MTKTAIRVKNETLNTIAAKTKVRKESLEIIAKNRNCFLVIDPDLHFGWQTYQKNDFDSRYSFVESENPHQFAEVVSN